MRLSNKPQKGFTLVELMVTIVIVAILALVGLTLFSGLQKQARDSRRQQDLAAIKNALETHYVANATTNNPAFCIVGGSSTSITAPGYCPLQGNWFSAGKVPVDPNAGYAEYCIQSGNTGASNSYANGVVTGYTDTTCASIAQTGSLVAFSTVAVNTPAIAAGIPANGWQVCARMESGSTSYYCVQNQQQ